MMRKKLHLILSSLSDIMNLPISEKELKYILERVKENRKLYNKLWSFWIEYTHQNSK